MRLIIVLLALSSLAFGSPEPGLPRQLRFEENRGQAASATSGFRTVGGRYVAEISERAIVLGDGVRLVFAGARPQAKWRPDDRVWTNRYLLGSERRQWIPEVPVYAKLRRDDLYPGIGIVLYGAGRDLEYDLVLAPGADPGQVRLRFEGAQAVRQLPGGTLRVESVAGEAWEQRLPEIFQMHGEQRRLVQGRFVARGDGEFGLELAAYDPSRTLVVDPVLTSLEVIGGENDDEITHSGRDPNNGQSFVAGHTRSVSFGRVRRRSRDIFITRLPLPGNPGTPGDTTFFGGSGDDELGSFSIARSTREWVLSGTTSSKDLPFASENDPAGSYQGGATDGFWARIGGRFQVLSLAGGYVGGSGEDRVAGAEFDFDSVVIGGHTNSRDLPTRGAWQTQLAGGTDLFVAIYQLPTRRLTFGTYYGGTGDEVARAFAGPLNWSWLGGETKSTDFPTTLGRADLQGGSDGFLLNIRRAFNGAEFSYQPAAQLVGGNAADAVTALFYERNLFNNTLPVFVAGTTRSTDLAVVNPAQPAPGGGADAFAGRLRFADSTWLSLTYWGGSGDEDARGIWADSADRIHLVGETRSADLPLKDPLQSVLAGPSDGFYLFLDLDNLPLQSTYFGGAGEDAANTVVGAGASVADWDSSVLVSGVSTSPELPLPPDNLPPDVPAGRNGFIAGITTAAILTPERVFLGKDLLSSVRVGLAQGPLTVRSTRPDLMRPIDDNNTPGAEVTLASPQAIGIEAYAESGEADLILSAPGFPSRTVKVVLRPAFVVMQPLPAVMATWSAALRPRVNFGAVNPETNQVDAYGFGLRTGLGEFEPRWVSSAPDVVAVSPTTPEGYPATTLQPVGLGVAEITISNPPLPILWGVNNRIEVVSPEVIVPATPGIIGRDLVTGFSVSFRVPGQANAPSPLARGSITFRSSDRTKLLLSLSPNSPGTDTVTATAQPNGFVGAFLHALTDSGGAEVIVSGEQFASARIPIQFTASQVLLNGGARELRVSPELGQGFVGVSVSNTEPRPAGSAPSGERVRPDLGNALIRFTSTNLGVVEPLTSAIPINTGTLTLRIVGPGEAELIAEASGANLAPARLKVISTPTPRTVELPREILVGKDLRTRVTGSVNPERFGAGEVVLRVTNPQVAGLSLGTQPGTQELRVRVERSSFEFWVEGFSASGATELTAEFPGAAPARSRIAVLASAITWTSPRADLVVGDRQQLRIAAVPLDDATGEPLGPMLPRVGVSITGTAEVSSNAIEISPAGFNLPDGTGSLQLRAVQAGNHSVRFTSSGPIPSTRENLRVAVSRSRILPPNGTIARDTAQAYSFRTTSYQGNSVFFTVTSLDPSRLLVSTSATAPGLPSVRVQGTQVFLQALAGDGVVRLSITAEDHIPGEAQISLTPLTPSLQGPFSGQTRAVDLRVPAQVSFAVTLDSLSRGTSLRPGVAPLEVNVSSNNPGVFTVEPARLTLVPGASRVEFRVNTTGPGSAELSVTSPQTSIAPSTVRIDVRRTSFSLETLTLGTQQQISGAVRLESGAEPPPEAFILSVTSADPSRLLLSRSPTTPGSASINVVWQARNPQSNQFFLQALGVAGDVSVTASGGPYQEATGTVVVQRSFFQFSDSSAYPLQVGGRMMPSVQLGPGYGDRPLRPGAPDVRVAVVSSNPGILTLPQESLLFREGDTRQSFLVVGRSPGTANLTLRPPEGFGPPPENASLTLTVRESTVELQCGGNQLAKDSRFACFFNAETTPELLTITSSDPAKVRFSMQPDSPVLTELRFSGTASATFFVHVYSDAGTVTLTAAASGFTTARKTFTLVPSALVFEGNTSFIVGLGQRRNVGIQLAGVSSSGELFPVQPRPGLNVRVNVTTSSAAVLRPDPAFVDFGPSSPSVQLVGVASGVATVTLVPPAGFPTRPEASRIVLVQ